MISKTKRKIRLNLQFTEAIKENITDLQNRTQSPTLTDVFRKALALYDLIVTHTKSGGDVIFRHKDGREETVRFL